MPSAVLSQKAPGRAAGLGVWLGWGGVAAAELFCLAVALIGGADPGGMLRFFLCCLFYLLLPSLALGEWLAPRQGAPHLVVSLVYGCGFLAGVHCVSVRFSLPWLLRLLPLGVGLAGLLRWLRRPHRRRALAAPGGYVVLWAALTVLCALCSGVVSPHPARAGAVQPNQDLLWNIGNAAALSRAFPAEDLRFSGVRLSYHYLTELLSAALSTVSGAALYDVYVFFAGPLFLAGELAALAALGGCFYPGRPALTRNFIALLYGFGCLSLWKVWATGESLFGNTLLRHLVTNINAQATALLFLAGVVWAFDALCRSAFRAGWRVYLLLFVSYFLLCLAKGPQAALALCAFCAAMAFVLLFHRPARLPALLATAGIAALFLAVYVWLFSGGSNSMTFSIFAMRDTVCYRLLSPYTDWLCAHLPVSGYVWLAGIGLVQVFCMAPFQMFLWLGTVPATLRRLHRIEPVRLFANAMVVGGFLAYLLYYHSSSSQVYFALAALIFLSLLAAEPLAGLARAGRCRRGMALLLGGAALFTTGCMVASFARQGGAQLGATLTHADRPAWGAVTGDDEVAMAWLDGHSAPTLTFATNRTSGTPDQENAISNVYSAFSGRQAYLEGWTYAMTNMGVSGDVLSHKQAVNGRLFTAETPPSDLLALCREEGIQCLVYAKSWPGAAPSWLAPSYENASVAIYLLPEGIP